MGFGAGIDLDALSAAELTYAEHGATRGELPPGYGHVARREMVGSGRDAFDRVAEALMTWRVHRGAGLAVLSSTPTVQADTVVMLRLGPPVVGVVAPVRVVYTIDEPDRKGFAYGTLPGHPERGEEAFTIQLVDADRIDFVIRAFSRPATLLARAGGPVQKLVTGRYIRVVKRLIRG
jgi:uncharacterized protein (UPF0548 family)